MVSVYYVLLDVQSYVLLITMVLMVRQEGCKLGSKPPNSRGFIRTPHSYLVSLRQLLLRRWSDISVIYISSEGRTNCPLMAVSKQPSTVGHLYTIKIYSMTYTCLYSEWVGQCPHIEISSILQRACGQPMVEFRSSGGQYWAQCRSIGIIPASTSVSP